MSREIADHRVLYVKGALFLTLSAIAATLVLLQQPSISILLLLIVLAWSAARAYYFVFYVIERYVDPTFHYSGIISLLMYLIRRRKSVCSPVILS